MYYSTTEQRFRALTIHSWLLSFLLLVPALAQGGHPGKAAVFFEHVQDVGFGNEVVLVGDHPDLGGWDPVRGIKLPWTSGNRWQGWVAIEAGAAYQYRFVVRSGSASVYCSAANSTDLTSVVSTSSPAAHPPPYSGKTILLYSTWSNAFVTVNNGGSWGLIPMDQIGPGRTAAEFLYRADGVSDSGVDMEFLFTDGMGGLHHPLAGGYGSSNSFFTSLDVLAVADGEVFNYRPPSTVSVPRLESATITSTVPGIPSRDIRIYLPRGYDQNTWKRYPALYMHDGQNIFYPGGPFGWWEADSTAKIEQLHGRMRECLIIGINNSANRIHEYLPPSDSYSGSSGVADDYVQFITDDVMHWVNANYRTTSLPGQPIDGANTMAAGSSLGGLVSAYMGVQHTNVFGKVGAFSPSFWIAPNFRATLIGNSKLPIRIYLDWGTAEGSGTWSRGWEIYNAWMQDGYQVNCELLLNIGCGQAHNEAAWAARFPDFCRFIMDPWDETNHLAQELHRPVLALQELDQSAGTATFGFTGMRGIHYDLMRSSNPPSWTPVATSPTVTDVFAPVTLQDTSLPAGLSHALWQVIAY